MGFITVPAGLVLQRQVAPGEKRAQHQEAYIFRFQRDAEKEKTLREYLHSSVFTEYESGEGGRP